MSILHKTCIALGLAAGLAALPAQATTQTVLHSMCSSGSCADGTTPSGTPLRASNGRLYGTTQGGGAHGGGTAYRYNPSTGVYTVLYDFCATGGFSCTDGSGPAHGLIMDTGGNLYGTAALGGAHSGGVAFELVKSGGTYSYTKLYDFCAVNTPVNCADGATPSSRLTYDGATSGSLYDGTSLLYGTTNSGGSSALAGTVFALKNVSGSWSEKVIHGFCTACSGADGSGPAAALFLDGSDNLWGTTRVGGSGSQGIAFKLTHGSDQWNDPWTENILYNFCWNGGSCPDGENPNGIFVKTGPLATTIYGTTQAGGSSTGPAGIGIVFKLTVGGCSEGGAATFWCQTVLYNFCSVSGCTDGATPTPGSDTLVDASGNIYGTTQLGGAFLGGVVYEVSGTSESVLYAFCPAVGCTDGQRPSSGVIADGSGNFFGTTSDGGAGSSPEGVLYELTP